MTKCDTCGKYFAGVTNFDAHRTGTFSPPTRRCMTDAEMITAGFASESAHGRVEWYVVKARERLLRVYGAKKGIPEEEEEAS